MSYTLTQKDPDLVQNLGYTLSPSDHREFEVWNGIVKAAWARQIAAQEQSAAQEHHAQRRAPAPLGAGLMPGVPARRPEA